MSGIEPDESGRIRLVWGAWVGTDSGCGVGMRIQDQAMQRAYGRFGEVMRLAQKSQKNIENEKALQALERDLDAALEDGSLSAAEAEGLLAQAQEIPGMESVVGMLEDFLRTDEDGIMSSGDAQKIQQELSRTSFLDQDLVDQQMLFRLESLIRQDLQVVATVNQKEHEIAMSIIRNIGSA